jgi:hypothetical protein
MSICASYQTIEMPPDGSCFYHCLDYCLSERPDYQRLLNKWGKKMNRYIDEIVEKHDVDIEKVFDGLSEHVRILRYATSLHITQEDFDNYLILCMGEDENVSYENVYEFCTGVFFKHDYVNQVVIHVLLRFLNQELMDEIGVYILIDEQIQSPQEWRNKPYNIMCEFINGNHYNVVHINNCDLLITRDEMEHIV